MARSERSSIPRQPKSYKLIALTQGKVAKVSNQDFDALSRMLWAFHRDGYAIWNWTLMHVYIMREIVGVKWNPELQLIDHKNGDGLDNRRSNLRIGDKVLNAANSKTPRNNTSGFKGVWRNKGRRLAKEWRANIQAEGKYIHIGYFRTKEEAAYVYDQFALALFGEFGRFNLIDKPTELWSSPD